MKQKVVTSFGDYTLDTNICNAYTNVELTIGLRLGFRQINPRQDATVGIYNDAGRDPHKIVRWDEHHWGRWLKTFVWNARRYWNHRFWLKNNFNLFEFKSNNGNYIPNIRCGFDLAATSVNDGPNEQYHHVVDVVKLDTSERWFNSHAHLYDNLDTRIATTDFDSRDKPIMQVANVHEVGHLLGLKHVGVGKFYCPANRNTNATVCYGINDRDRNSVMGAGMWVKKEHALPWRRAIVALTGRGEFTCPSDWIASSIQIYPRTLSEVASDKSITTMPMR